MFSLILHVRRSIELQKCRILVKFIENSSPFSTSFSSVAVAAADEVSPRDVRKGKNFIVSSYLVDSLGLTAKLAESISWKVSFKEKGNPDSVVILLRSHGFTDSQISTIITEYPRLLVADAEKSLGPKLQFLQSGGASTSELTEVLSKVPKILGIKKDKTFSVYYDFVKDIIEADKSSKLEKLCLSLQEGGKHENKIRNILVLRELGKPQRLLFSLLTSHAQPIYGKEKFQESLKKVVEMGFDPTSSRFVDALHAIYQMSDETTEEKVNFFCKRLGFAVEDVWEMFKKWPHSLMHSEKKITQVFETLKKCGLVKNDICSVFKKFPQCTDVSEQNILNAVETFLGLGFSRDEFAKMIRRCPQCIGMSAETVKKKTEFVVKKMNWPLKAVVLFPQVISYSMEKRIVPRCYVIKALMSKGLIGSELPPVSSVFVCTDQKFLNRYVRMHDDKELVTELMAIFTGETRTNR